MTDEMGIERLKNDYRELYDMRTNRVHIKSVPKSAGALALIEITVYVPTYYIVGPTDRCPKPTDVITFYIEILDGFPRTKPHVYFNKDKILAGVNTFTSGSQCIDEWFYDEDHAGCNSTLVGTAQKTIMAIVHDPAVARYDSMANSSLAAWQKTKTESGEFPSCRINELLKVDGDVGRMPSLPVKAAKSVGKVRPALPTR